jgi:4,5-DOPA dioxygenase extradiol
MNALGGNAFAAALNGLGKALPRPRAIVLVSAHWRTRGTQVLNQNAPKMIYDMSGFPPALYEIVYPARGDEAVSADVVRLIAPLGGEATAEWGFDHGAWSVLCHLYPEADIPVVMLSLDKKARMDEHFKVAEALTPLRDQGVLIIGSGNITHNLGDLDWDGKAQPFDWAVEFDRLIAQAIIARDLDTLLHFKGIPEKLHRHALPTHEHYHPLLYALGAATENDRVSYPYEEMQNGSLSMRAVLFGA